MNILNYIFKTECPHKQKYGCWLNSNCYNCKYNLGWSCELEKKEEDSK